MTATRCQRCGKVADLDPDATMCAECVAARQLPRVIPAFTSATWRPSRRKRSRGKRQ